MAWQGVVDVDIVRERAKLASVAGYRRTVLLAEQLDGQSLALTVQLTGDGIPLRAPVPAEIFGVTWWGLPFESTWPGAVGACGALIVKTTLAGVTKEWVSDLAQGTFILPPADQVVVEFGIYAKDDPLDPPLVPLPFNERFSIACSLGQAPANGAATSPWYCTRAGIIEFNGEQQVNYAAEWRPYAWQGRIKMLAVLIDANPSVMRFRLLDQAMSIDSGEPSTNLNWWLPRQCDRYSAWAFNLDSDDLAGALVLWTQELRP